MVSEAMEVRAMRAEAGLGQVAALASVTKRYGAVTALDELSLTLGRGEVLALLGPNGAGKSTAIRCLLGLIAPTSGTARVFGRDPREASARTRIGAMLQVARIPEALTAREHLDLFRSYYPKPLAMEEIVRVAQLEGFVDRQFGKLSGGQKQRVLFGLAIAGDPDLIFLDEPTVGMDIEARRGLWEQIRALAARGKTVLLTTHYLEEADALAHRVVVIDKGRIVSEGTPAEIKRMAAGASGRRVRCRTGLSDEFLWTLPTVSGVSRLAGVVTVMAVDAEAVLREMLEADAGLADLEVSSMGLEDAFLELTKGRGRFWGFWARETWLNGGFRTDNRVWEDAMASAVVIAPMGPIFGKETKYEFLKLLRTRSFSASVIGFPVMFYLLFGVANKHAYSESVHIAKYMLGGYAVFGLVGAALFGIGVGLATERAAGWLEVKQASPMPPAAYLFAKCASAVGFGLIIVTILTVLGITLGGVSLTVSEYARMMGLTVVGSVAFASMGLLLALVVPANAAPGIVNLIYLPMSFLSGLWIPLRMLPKWLQPVAPLLPTYHLAQLMQHVFGYQDGASMTSHWAGLGGFTMLMLGTSWLIFSRAQKNA